MGAATRYLSQRYTAPWGQVKAGLTDIGTEELAHIEIVSAILYQLTKGLTVEQIKEGGMEAYFVDHTTGIYPQAASGMPFSTATLQSTKKWLIYAEKQLDNLCVGEKSGVQFPSPPPDGHYTNTYFFKGGFAVRVWL